MKKGFTLIELLVVIAIIGVLSSIVLVSLGDSQSTANEVASKAELGQLRAISASAQAKGTSNLSTFCAGGAGTDFASVRTITNSISSRLGGNTAAAATNTTTSNVTLTGSKVACHDLADSWVAAFATSSAKAWCVDSAGFAGEITPATSGTSGIVLITSGVLKINTAVKKCN